MKRVHRHAAMVASIAAIAAMSVVVPAAQAAPAKPTNPFASTTKFCEKHSPPAGKRNSSSPGVTPSSITLVAANIDVAGLARLGIQLAPADRIWGALVDEINQNCGGINGRKLILKKALGNPLSTDPTASRTAGCIKATEDYKAFAVVHNQNPRPFPRCVTYQHKSIMLSSTPGAYNTADIIASKGRLFSIYPADDQAAAAFLAYGFKNRVFDNKKVLVLATQFAASTAQDMATQYVEPLKKKGIDAYAEVFPCVGTASNCTGQMGAVISRAKANGVDLIVTSTQWGTGMGVIWKNMFEQNFRVPIIGAHNGPLHSDSTLPSQLAVSGDAAARFISNIGETAIATDDQNVHPGFRTGAKQTAFGKMCMDLVNKRLKNSPAWNYTERFSDFWVSTTIGCRDARAFARAIWSLGNNVTTERAVAALAKEIDQDKPETTPVMRTRQWYSIGNYKPEKSVALRFAYPCPGSASANTACMIPVDRPMRALPN